MRVSVVLSRRFQKWALLLFAFCTIAALGPHVNPRGYDSSVFDVVEKVTWKMWTVGWGIGAVLQLTAAITRSYRVWLVACWAVFFPSLFWLIGVLWAHYVLGARLSLMGQALWLYVVCSLVLLVTSPNQVVGKIDTPSGDNCH